MLEHLFGSRTRVRLLRLFYREPARHFFVRELTRLLETQINAVRRELVHLTASGIVLAVDAPESAPGEEEDAYEAKRKYYRLNEKSPLYAELRALLLKSHVLGETSLREQIAAAGDIQLLIFTGIFLNASTPIDMLVVGTVSEKRVAEIVADFERENAMQLRYTILSAANYDERQHLMDRFLFDVLDAPHEKAINTLV